MLVKVKDNFGLAFGLVFGLVFVNNKAFFEQKYVDRIMQVKHYSYY